MIKFFKSPNSQDYFKVARAIPVKGFDASGKITDSEMKKVIVEDPLMQVLVFQRFFLIRRSPIEYSDKREVKLCDGKDGKLKLDPVFGHTFRDPKTGKIKKIVINEHRLKDLKYYVVENGFIKEEEIEKASSEKKDEAIKKIILATCAHERRGHMFTVEMLNEKAKSKVVNLFYSIKERGATFISRYAQINPEEYFAEGWGIYEVNPELLKEKDPELYNLIQEIEKECRSFIEERKKRV